MRFLIALAFVFTTSAVFACEHDQASNGDVRTVASAKAETTKAGKKDEGQSCGEAGCSCAKESKACGCDHKDHKNNCECSECAKHKGHTTS